MPTMRIARTLPSNEAKGVREHCLIQSPYLVGRSNGNDHSARRSTGALSGRCRAWPSFSPPGEIAPQCFDRAEEWSGRSLLVNDPRIAGLRGIIPLRRADRAAPHSAQLHGARRGPHPPETRPKGLTQLSVDDVQRFVTRRRGSGLSPRTVRYLLVVLRMALKKAEASARWRVTSPRSQPGPGSSAGRSSRSPSSKRAASSPHSKANGSAHFSRRRDQGPRLGETLALRWSDLDLDQEVATLRVAHTLPREGRGTERRWHPAPPKSAKSVRCLHLSPTLVDALRAHRVQQLEERMLAGPSWEAHDLVFATLRGGPLDERNARRAFYRVIAKAGLPTKRLHDLRQATRPCCG